jgi:hypothetical protein
VIAKPSTFRHPKSTDDPDTTEDDFTDTVTVVRVPYWLEL